MGLEVERLCFLAVIETCHESFLSCSFFSASFFFFFFFSNIVNLLVARSLLVARLSPRFCLLSGRKNRHKVKLQFSQLVFNVVWSN